MPEPICPVHKVPCLRYTSGAVFCPECEKAVPVAEAVRDPQAFVDGMEVTHTIRHGIPNLRGKPLPPDHGDGPTPAEAQALLRIAGQLDRETRRRLDALEARVAVQESAARGLDARIGVLEAAHGKAVRA